MSKVLYKLDNLNIIGQIDVSGISGETKEEINYFYNLKLTINIFVNGKLKLFHLNFALKEGERGEIKTLELEQYYSFRIFEEILWGMGYEMKDGDFAVNPNKWVEELINGYDGKKFLVY